MLKLEFMWFVYLTSLLIFGIFILNLKMPLFKFEIHTNLLVQNIIRQAYFDRVIIVSNDRYNLIFINPIHNYACQL